MKKNIFKKLYITIFFVAAVFITGYSHFMWISPAGYVLNKGDILKLRFPSAHLFPATATTEIVEKDKMSDTLLYDPSGKSVKLSLWNGDILESKRLNREGTYLVVSGKKGAFFSKTSDGRYEKKPKDEVLNAVKCTYSKSFNKAIVTVGAPAGNTYSKVLGHDIEIIPLRDPGTLKIGTELQMKVLLNGRPYETGVDAIYDGFTKEENKFAQQVKTDKKGIATIKITNTGSWLVKVNNKIPYKNLKKADEQSYTATLTFFIK